MASQDRADEQSIRRSPNCSQSPDRLPHSITAPFPSINTDQQHVQRTWYQLSIKDRVTLSNKLVSVSPAVRRSFNDILGQLGLNDLDVLREWFISCHPHHFSVAIEIWTNLKRDHKMFDARAELKGLALAERLKLLPRLLASLLTSQLAAGAMDVVQLPSRRSWLSLTTKSANNQLKGAP